MDVDAVPGRTTLGVTTLLTVSSKSAGKTFYHVTTPLFETIASDLLPVLACRCSFNKKFEN
jgi:hypothetical protein